MFVYVLNKLGEPQMPCKPAVARLFLKEGKAKVKNKMSYTVKLLEGTTEFKRKQWGEEDSIPLLTIKLLNSIKPVYSSRMLTGLV